MATSRKFLIYANPRSGKGNGTTVTRKVVQMLVAQSKSYHLIEEQLELDQDPSPYKAQGFTDLVLIGGDGTINEGVNIFFPLHLPLMIFPAGRGNDYVKNFNLGATVEEQFDTMMKAGVKKADVGICNKRMFLNGVGIGFDGQIVANMAGKKGWFTGFAAYYFEVIKILSFYRSRWASYNVDGVDHQERIFLMTIAKGTTFGGGFVITPHAQVDDGQLAVCIVKPMLGIKRFGFMGHFKLGTHLGHKFSRDFKASNISMQPQPKLVAHIDGELMGSPPFEFSILPGALQVRSW